MSEQELRAELALARERVETELVEKEALQLRIDSLQKDVETMKGMLSIEDAELAEAYEKSGLYDQILDESDEYLAEASEWHVRLAGDPGGTVPPLQDPEIEAYPVEVAAFSDRADQFSSRGIYLRIVAARVEQGKFDELKETYDRQIKPDLMATKGCRAVFLVEGVGASSRALSVTVWDSEEDAIRYELSGAFDENVAKVSEYFSGLYQWKLSLATDSRRESVSGKDLDVSGYQQVIGRRLGA